MIDIEGNDISDPVIQFLSSMSGQHVHFFPNPGNAGDGFIAHATYALFEHFGISHTAYRQTEIASGEPVVIGGGGNLVEGRYTDVADLIRRHSSRKTVLLPHTIVGYSDVVSRTDSNLTLFVRDPVSYDLALANGANEQRTFLSRDLVFFLDDSFFAAFQKPGKGILHALRVDGETAGTLPIRPDNIDLSLSWNGDLWSDRQFCRASTETLASYICQFESVLTDRLHIAILSAMLGKRVTMLPNAYFKNRAVYEHSMRSRFPRLRFVNVLPTDVATDAPDLSPEGIAHRRRSAEALERETTRREAAERSLERYRHEVEEKDDTRAALERETAREQAERELERCRHELEQCYDEIERKDAARTGLEQRITMLEQQFAASELEMSAIRSSTSWRLTAPLRRMKTLLQHN